MRLNPVQRLWWTIYWLFLVISFCVVGFWLVSESMGFRYNPHLHRLQKTGMLIISNGPKESMIRLDGKSYPTVVSQTRIPNVLPGTYHVKIEKPNYTAWEDVINITPGYVIDIDNIQLFPSKPVELPNPDHYQSLLPYYQTNNDSLRIEEGELWLGTQLVSRFNQPPSTAILLPGNHYIAYLQGVDVRVIDTNGNHDQLLFARKNSDPSPLVLIDNALVFSDGGVLKAISIQ